jgi:IS30 family transposase
MPMRKKYHRAGFGAAQSAELRERWTKGEGLKSIGRALGKPSSCIFAHIRPSGGICPRSGRPESTVSREIGRNGRSRRYRAEAADNCAWKQALRPKPCKLAVHDHLRQAVATKLDLDWSPEQIAGWLKRTYPGNEARHVFHETIYRSLYVELMQHLRSRRPIRRSRHATAKADQRGRIPDAVSISERPASVEDRAVPGHWEATCFAGRRTAISSPWSNATRAI